MPDIDVGQFSEALNDKMDRDGNNPATGALENIARGSGADFVVEYQVPTAQNNYTWYRLYKSGWVEQGGYYSAPSAATATVDLLIPFQNTDYSILLTNLYNASSTKNPVHVISLSTNNFLYWCENYNGSVYWEAKGMSAQS